MRIQAHSGSAGAHTPFLVSVRTGLLMDWTLKNKAPITLGRAAFRFSFWWLVLVVMILCYAVPEFCRISVNHAVGLMADSDLAALRAYLLGFGFWAPLVSAGLMVLQAIVAPIPGFMLGVVNGLLFGVVWGTLLTWGSALLAASVCYMLTSICRHTLFERFVSRNAFAAGHRLFDRYGIYAIIVARLIPVVSFDAISYGAGLIGVRFGTFLAATAIGSLPGIVFFVLIGDYAPQLIHFFAG